VELVTKNEPMTGEAIAETLGVSRPTIRSDLAVLVMLGILDAKPKVGYFLGEGAHSDAGHLKKLRELKVKTVQGVPIVVRDTATVHDAVVTLFMENVGTLIVVDAEGELVGMVSRKDLLKVTLGNPGATTMPVSMIMTRKPNIVTVDAEDSVLEAAEKMIRHEVDCLPVMARDEKGKRAVAGRVTKTTMTRLLLEWATGAITNGLGSEGQDIE
jgi:CBS domain-containing protein